MNNNIKIVKLSLVSFAVLSLLPQSIISMGRLGSMPPHKGRGEPKPQPELKLISPGHTTWKELMQAIIKDKIKVATALINEMPKGDRAKIINKAGIEKGWTPLIFAAYYGYPEIVNLLMNNGAKINAQDSNGWTALVHAIYGNKAKIVSLLIDLGADVNITDTDKSTPLMLAALEGRLEIVKILIDAGANVNAKNDVGDTALDLAISEQNELPLGSEPYIKYQEIIDILLKNGAQPASKKLLKPKSMQVPPL